MNVIPLLFMNEIPTIVALITVACMLAGNIVALCLLMYKVGRWVSLIEGRFTNIEMRLDQVERRLG